METDPRPAAARWTDAWRESYGPHWPAKLALLGALVVLFAALTPPADPDLPIHLAAGEWIARHRAVPFVEPWAWTRSGAPFQAYSWAIEVAFYLALRAGSAAGLQLLHGLLVGAAGAAVIALGAAAGWRPRTSLIMALINLSVAALVACCVRPQIVLFALVPLAWALAHRMAHRGASWRNAVGVFAVSAIAANTHLLFPLVAAPGIVLLVEPRERPLRARAISIGGFALAVLLGWAASPYVLEWPAVFRLNFAPNPLIVYPSPLGEYVPGFVSGVTLGPAPLSLILAVAALPWLVPERVLGGRARLAAGMYWLVGLVAFALTARAFLLWWLLVLPTAALAVELAGSYLAREEPLPRHLRILALWAVCSVFLLTRLSAFHTDGEPVGTVASRTLPSPAAPWVDPIADWLACNVRAGSGGRIFTTHGFGSYLIWRLPDFSPSIDGRTIFPDSVAHPETFRGAWDRGPAYGPWASADLAILPRSFAVTSVLDTATGWRRVVDVNREEGTTGLWVAERWWGRVGRSPLPPRARWLSPGHPACGDALSSDVAIR
jgi:hypothetical protein